MSTTACLNRGGAAGSGAAPSRAATLAGTGSAGGDRTLPEGAPPREVAAVDGRLQGVANVMKMTGLIPRMPRARFPQQRRGYAHIGGGVEQSRLGKSKENLKESRILVAHLNTAVGADSSTHLTENLGAALPSSPLPPTHTAVSTCLPAQTCSARWPGGVGNGARGKDARMPRRLRERRPLGSEGGVKGRKRGRGDESARAGKRGWMGIVSGYAARRSVCVRGHCN